MSLTLYTFTLFKTFLIGQYWFLGIQRGQAHRSLVFWERPVYTRWMSAIVMSSCYTFTS